MQRKQRDLNGKRRQFTQKLNRINSELHGCSNIGTQIRKFKIEIEKYNNNNITEWEQRINDCDTAINGNNSKMRALNIERQSLQTQSEQTAKLYFKAEQ